MEVNVELKKLFEQNATWAESVSQQDSTFFTESAKGQAPEYLWIGCADSRVPPNQLTGTGPGELFVHRNIANMVVEDDLSCLSVMQYSIQYLQVKQVVVCGHYGCGGVKAAMEGQPLGLIDNWLVNIQKGLALHEAEFTINPDSEESFRQACELNVIEQVRNVCNTSIVQDAWDRGQALTVHGLIYDLADGQLKDLSVTINNRDAINSACAAAVENITG